MSVKIRLARRGRKKLSLFDIVVSDARSPRDGKFIEKIGVYNPNTNPATIELNEQKAFTWLMNGAEPTDTVHAMLSYKGILYKKHLQVGVNKGAITQEAADAKLASWIEAKTNKIEGKKTKLATDKGTAAKARFEAEVKVNAAREEALKNKNKVEEVVAAEAIAESAEALVAEEIAVAAEVAPVVESPVAVVETPVAVVEAEAAAVAEPAAETPAAAIEVVAETAPVAVEAPEVAEKTETPVAAE
ncbi:MAG: 30S ribosomal protein S16 [Cytophagales bacterium]